MKTLFIPMLLIAILVGCGRPTPPNIGLADAARSGNLEAIRQHIKAASNLNELEPVGGSSALSTAAAFGQTEAVGALIQAGADVNVRNKDGATPLITAAFLCRTDIVRTLLDHGADKNAKNNAGVTALDSVTASFDEAKGVYDLLQAVLGPLGLKLDYEQIRATRPEVAKMLQ